MPGFPQRSALSAVGWLLRQCSLSLGAILDAGSYGSCLDCLTASLLQLVINSWKGPLAPQFALRPITTFVPLLRVYLNLL